MLKKNTLRELYLIDNLFVSQAAISSNESSEINHIHFNRRDVKGIAVLIRLLYLSRNGWRHMRGSLPGLWLRVPARVCENIFSLTCETNAFRHVRFCVLAWTRSVTVRVDASI